MTNRFYITTPIYYVNDRPHIGHVYTTLVADVVARHRRQRGDEVFFLTGTDEHAPKVAESAREHGVEPLGLGRPARGGVRADVRGVRDQQRRLHPHHPAAPQSSGCSEYLGRAARERRRLPGPATTAGTTPARRSTSPRRGPPGSTTARRSAASRWSGAQEENYFFRLSAYADDLLRLLDERPDFVQPTARRNEVVGRIRDGLHDIPISRTGPGLGHRHARRRAAHGLRLDRRPLQLRLGGRHAGAAPPLAGRRPPDRQGHPLVPRA